MWIRALGFVALQLWLLPVEIVLGATILCVVGGIASTGTSIWVRRWPRSTSSVARSALASDLAAICPGSLPWILVAFFLLDWGMLYALPVLRLSFAFRVWPPLALSTGVRLMMLGGLSWVRLVTYIRSRRAASQLSARGVVTALLIGNLFLSGVQIYGYMVEPLLVETTRLSLSYADLDPTAPPLRVVHLTDTHIERNSYREASVVRLVNALQPDIIVLTGDYLNLSRLDDPVSAAHFRELIGQLQAPYGIYAVRGSTDAAPEWMAYLVEGTAIRWLEQEAVTVKARGQLVTLVGIACSHNRDRDTARLEQALHGVPEEAFTLLLYHSPDLIEEASRLGIDMYLGGHTHGGQVRLPLYGAIVTGSGYHKRYEAGLFEEGGTRMYISRGLGFEGGGAPRVRFLCRPEIVSIDLLPQ